MANLSLRLMLTAHSRATPLHQGDRRFGVLVVQRLVIEGDDGRFVLFDLRGFVRMSVCRSERDAYTKNESFDERHYLTPSGAAACLPRGTTIGKVFPMSEAAEAVRYLIEGRPFGRVLMHAQHQGWDS